MKEYPTKGLRNEVEKWKKEVCSTIGCKASEAMLGSRSIFLLEQASILLEKVLTSADGHEDLIRLYREKLKTFNEGE